MQNISAQWGQAAAWAAGVCVPRVQEFRGSSSLARLHMNMQFTYIYCIYFAIRVSFSHQSTRSMKLHITRLQSSAWDAQFFFSTRNQTYQKSRDAMPSRNLLLAPLHVLSNWMQKDGYWSAAKN